MANLIPITVAYGDGIGPEIMRAALRVLQAAGVSLDLHVIELGEQVYQRGYTAGIEPSAWDAIRKTRVLYKAPITTPQGGGYKSLNVTLRKSLALFANVRPSTAYDPFVVTRHPTMDVVIVRENEEDLYAGVEHHQTDEMYQCLKLISRPGTERIIRYAFEYARANGRKKVSCFTKDNIMKLTDGLFHRVFDEIAPEYPELKTDHWIIDIGAARLADQPELFDVIVTTNLYGDIISDIAAEIAGSVGMAGSANIGEHAAMFEAIHGSAPDIAGRGIANPSGLLMAGVMMLVHVGQPEAATLIHNAWLRTIEDGIHTADIYYEGRSRARVSTEQFADAVIERLGQLPQRLDKAHYTTHGEHKAVRVPAARPAPQQHKTLVGADVFLHHRDRDAHALGLRLEREINGDGLVLNMLSNRGLKVYPGGLAETFCTDHWRCRFVTEAQDAVVSHAQILALLQRLDAAGLEWVKMELLFNFDGVPGFSLGQGQ
jgi:isocitrate dehydrogenase